MRLVRIAMALLTYSFLLSVHLTGTAAFAETRALLIGVSDYDHEIGLADLKGPANDVRLLEKALRARGVKDIRILANGGAAGTAVNPTRKAIADAFADLAKTAKSGDLVFVHFSGHGTQQRDTNGDESDALDEVFLPSDTLPAKPGVGLIRNAIVDDELGRWVDAIRATGADVWLTIDACHAGTGLRDGDPMVASRAVDPAILGIGRSKPQPEQPPSPPDSETRQINGAGDFIAFYAAQSNEVARELNFTAMAGRETAPDGWYGLFTSRIARHLSAPGELTYRRLFTSVLDDINTMPLPDGTRRQTPSWEGTMPDRNILSREAGISSLIYRVERGQLQAGTINGIAEGSILRLSRQASPDAAPIGYAQVAVANTRSATLRPVGEDCMARSGDTCPALGSLDANARFASVIVPVAPAPVRFAPISSADADGADIEALTSAFTAAAKRMLAARRASVQLEAQDADVRVVIRGKRIWFGRMLDTDGEPTGLSWNIESNEPLQPILERIVAAERLAKRLASIQREATILNPNPVSARVTYRASDSALLAKEPGRMTPEEECGAMFEKGAYGRAQTLSNSTARLKQCDSITVSARAALPGARDINVIHIDANYCVTSQYARLKDERAESPIGPGLIACSECPGGNSVGFERLFVVVAEARQHKEPLNLTGVFANCDSRTNARSSGTLSRTRGGRQPVGDMAPASALFAKSEQDTIWVDGFSWKIIPRAMAISE